MIGANVTETLFTIVKRNNERREDSEVLVLWTEVGYTRCVVKRGVSRDRTKGGYSSNDYFILLTRR